MTLRITILLLAFALSFTHAGAAPAKVKGTAAVRPVVDTAALENSLAAETEARREAQHNASIAEAKAELISAANSRLENWIALYGILITIIFATAGFFTWRSAANAARSEVQDMRDELAKIAKQAREAKEKIDHLALDASNRHKGIVDISDALAARANALPGEGETLSSATVDAELRRATNNIEAHPKHEWSPLEYRLMILRAEAEGNWEHYIDLARKMAEAHSEDPEDRAYALFAVAYGLSKLDKFDLASNAYADYIESCPEDKPADHAKALSNWGNALDEQAKLKASAGDREGAKRLWTLASEKHAEAIALAPDMDVAFSNWGIVYNEMAKDSSSAGRQVDADNFWNLATEKYSAALAINPKSHVAYSNWGNVLHERATAKAAIRDYDEADSLWAIAIEKYVEAIACDANMYEAYNNLGCSLIAFGNRKTEEERERLLARAEEALNKANGLRPGCASYNLACIAGVRGDAETAAKMLRDAKDKDTSFPKCSQILADRDFDRVRDSAVFQHALIDVGCNVADKKGGLNDD
ncbi:hypothetical protein [Sphingopyxis sp. Root214]|uniref:hypothetical protein n=1 Tax=Sphingopyxis sp. Root214 TaxID=1736491 RepID=UPI000A6661EA|nr:hypothetical protein [Sphingopyxis sp. Root214]